MKRSAFGAAVLSAAVGLLSVSACKGGSDEYVIEPIPSAAEAQSAAAARSPAAEEIPWPKLPVLDATRKPATPGAYPSDKAARFVIFGASWCGGCVASVLHDAELARSYKGRLEVAVALQEEDADFTKSTLSRWLAEVPIYNQSTTSAVAKRCKVVGIPSACLLDGDQVLWTGNPNDGAVIIDAHLDGHLDQALARISEAKSAYDAALESPSPSSRTRAVEALRGFAGRENSLAWDLVDQRQPSEAELALGVELARDAVKATHGLDFAVLDTYGLGLAKSGHVARAARVGARVIAVCDAIGGHCSEERARAEKFVAAAR